MRVQTLAIANGVVSFPMNGFGLALNPADIRAINVQIGAINNAEAPIITAITAVPEPASGLLVAFGLVGLAVRRRRAE